MSVQALAGLTHHSEHDPMVGKCFSLAPQMVTFICHRPPFQHFQPSQPSFLLWPLPSFQAVEEKHLLQPPGQQVEAELGLRGPKLN